MFLVVDSELTLSGIDKGDLWQIKEPKPIAYMMVRTCLLISEDPDDQIEFSEALYEISDEMVLLTVSEVDKAIDLLRLKKCLPEFIFIHLGLLSDSEPDLFFNTLESDTELKKVKVIAFGDPDPLASSPRITAFLNSTMNFAELKVALKGITA